jgi:hypothetical protein
MKLSSAPSFGAPGSLILGVAHNKLKKHKFMLITLYVTAIVERARAFNET